MSQYWAVFKKYNSCCESTEMKANRNAIRFKLNHLIKHGK